MTPIRQLIKSLLVFKAINQIAIIELENLDGTPFFDKKMANCISKIIGQLEMCLEKNYDLLLAEEVQQGMFQLQNFYEKWTDQVTGLNEDQIMDLNNNLEIFFHNIKKSRNVFSERGQIDDLNQLQNLQ